MIYLECHGGRMFWSVENKRWECRQCDAHVEVTKEMMERGITTNNSLRRLRESLA